MSKASPINTVRVGLGLLDISQEEAIRKIEKRSNSMPIEPTATTPAVVAQGNADPKHRNHDTKEIKPVEVDRMERLEKDNAALKHELKKEKAKTQEANAEAAKMLDNVNAFNIELQKTRHRLSQADAAVQRAQSQGGYNTLRNEYSKLENSYLELVERYRAAEHKVRTSGSQLRRAEEESRLNMQSLYSENERLAEKMKENEAYMDQLLQNAMKDGRWNPPPDSTIRDRLDRLHSDTKEWAKKWTHETFSIAHLTPEQSAGVKKLFANFVRMEPDGHLPPAIENPTSKMKSKIAGLLLTAAVAHRLQIEFFENPFFCFEPQQANVLRDVYWNLRAANFQQSHVWRSTVWRILNPPMTTNTTAHDRSVIEETARRVRSLCDHIVTDFLASPVGILLTPLNDSEKPERAKSLREILLKAAEVATSLWTQRSYLSCVNIKDIVDLQITYTVTSTVLSAHPLNKVDAEDVSNNGRGVLIVTRPTILAFDDNDEKGLKGDHFRILAKAIVWLEDTKKGGLFR